MTTTRPKPAAWQTHADDIRIGDGPVDQRVDSEDRDIVIVAHRYIGRFKQLAQTFDMCRSAFASPAVSLEGQGVVGLTMPPTATTASLRRSWHFDFKPHRRASTS